MGCWSFASLGGLFFVVLYLTYRVVAYREYDILSILIPAVIIVAFIILLIRLEKH